MAFVRDLESGHLGFYALFVSLWYLANISVWLFLKEQNQGVSLKVLPRKDAFSHVFSDSACCIQHTPSLDSSFPIFKRLWCYIFVFEFCGWNQFFEITKSSNLMLYSMPNILLAVLIRYFLHDCIDLFYEITRNVNHLGIPLAATFGM